MNITQNILITGADGQLGMTFKSLLLDDLDDKYKSNANRPNFSLLLAEKIQNKYKFAIPSWMDALKDNFELTCE